MEFLNPNFFKNKKKTILFLLAPAVLLFFKTLAYNFTSLDEQWMLIKNVSFLERWSSVGDAFSKPMAEIYYRPLLMSSFIVDYHIGKLSPFIYHFTNLLLHLSSVYLLFRFLLAFKVDDKTAFVLSLIFSVHPMILHAVAWIPGRNDLLLSVFSLLSFINLKKYLADRKVKDLALHLFFFTCALLTKENALALIFVFFFIWWMESKESRKNGLVLSVSWLLLVIMFFILHNHVVGSTNSFVLNGKGIADFFMGLAMAFGKNIFPVSQSIMPLISMSAVVLGGIALAGVAVLFYKQAFKDKRLAVLGLLIFISLLILPLWFSAMKPGSEYYEHRSYTSLAGLMLFVSQIQFDRNSKMFQNAVIILFCFFFIKSFVRLPVYKDTKNFVEAGLKERPDYYLFLQQKAEELYKQKDFYKANELFSKAIQLRPDKAELYSNRGSCEFALRMYPEAIRDFSEAINKSEFKMEYYINRCVVYNKINDVPNALKDYEVLKKCCSDQIPASLENDLKAKGQSKTH